VDLETIIYNKVNYMNENKVRPRKWIETIPGMWMCGNCGHYVNVIDDKCPQCGKEIDWNGVGKRKRKVDSMVSD